MSTIVTRAGKGSPLTHDEVDSNFTNLNSDKYQSGNALGTPASGNLANCTGYTYSNLSGTVPTWNQNTTGNAATVTNGVYTSDIGSTVLAYDSNLQSFVSTFTLPTTDSTNGYVLATNGSGTLSFVAQSTGTGTVTSVGMTVPTGLTVSGSPITSSGTFAVTLTSGYTIPTTTSTGQWDTAYSDRLKWDGGSTGLNASTGRTSLGLVIGTDVLAYDSNLQSFVNTFTLPTTDSTSGYVLSTNGSGTLSWVANGSGGSMVYPGAGIPNSTGSAWGTSYSTSGSGTVVALTESPSFTTPALGTPTSGTLTNCTGYTYANLTGTVPTWNQNTTGSAGSVAYSLTAGSGISFSSGTTYNGSAAITISATGGGGGTSVGLVRAIASNCIFP